MMGLVGLVFSILYVVLVYWIFSQTDVRLLELRPNEIGDFLAGALGPLAIFWLVLGFFQQGRELRNSIDQVKIQTEELKLSVEQQKRLSSATERQLELEEQTWRRQTEAERNSNSPNFIMRFTDRTDGDRREVSLLNTGSVAYAVTFSFIPANTG